MNKVLKEVAVCGAIIAGSAMVYWDSLKLPAGMYDPLGAGTLPRIVSVAIIVLALVVIAQAVVASRARPVNDRAKQERDYVLRPGLAAAVFAYVVVLAVLMKMGVSFWISSSLFLFVSTLTIARFRWSAILPAAVFSVVAAASLTYLFGTIFMVDLP